MQNNPARNDTPIVKEHALLSRVTPSNLSGHGGMVGNSPVMQHLYELIEKVSQNKFPILILGETGTGKELVAHYIHSAGQRRADAFVPVDCSALSPMLIESELFGHVKGAFTDADHAKVGLLQSANGGTVFLDEIGELPLLLQAKLLRALQEKEIRPVGSTGRIPINVRIIAATNRNLQAGIRAGTFRQDLYFRLNVVEITLPTLRIHKIDIPLLVAHFLEKFSDPFHPAHEFSDDAMQKLLAYNWPGNVRELENVIECAVALSSAHMLTIDDLASIPRAVGCVLDSDELLPLVEIQRRAILRAVQKAGNDRVQAARLLGIGKTTLYRKLRAYLADSSNGAVHGRSS
jgi:DNA-binding NtrC family response regulator